MSADERQSPKRIRFIKLLLISFALCAGSFVIEQTLRWSDPLDGFFSGLIMAFIVGVNWCIVTLPWSLVIWLIYHWRNWHRFRTYWVLAPAVVQALFIVIGLFLSPPTARGSFKRFAAAEIPVDARNVKYHLWGGGTADYNITYYFECRPESLDKLTAEMKLEAVSELTGETVQYLPMIKKLPGCPDPKEWIGGRVYSRDMDENGWDFTMIVDPTRTKVYVWMWCI